MSREKKQQLSQAKSFITGMPKHCSKMSFSVNGVTYTTPKVVAACNALLSADNATVQAKAEYGAAVKEEHKLLATLAPVLLVVKQQVALTFENSPGTLADLGVTPRKAPAPLTTKVLAAKMVKAQATRQARGTTSKKQKAAVSGNVSGVTITPVVVGAAAPAATPSAPASPATPASSIAVAADGTPTHS